MSPPPKQEPFPNHIELPRLIRAAASPNIGRLEALLRSYARKSNDETFCEKISPSTTFLYRGIIRSPISTAIDHDQLDNARLLLAAGADPDGIELSAIADYSVRWIRGRHPEDDLNSLGTCKPRAQVLAIARSEKGIAYPTSPLTEAELDQRRLGFPQFWTEPNPPGLNLPMGRAMTALENAARHGTIQSLDLLRAAGADESAWLQRSEGDDRNESENLDQLFDIRDEHDVPISALSTSSPIHEAITAGQQTMLQHLLSTCGYSPNYCPRAAPTAALPPLSHAIARCSIRNVRIRRCLVDLLSHPRLDVNLRTPIFHVHPLHFATALHNAEFLSWLADFVPGGLKVAGVTALGHTLLHIASLPLTVHQTAAHNPDVAKSIHCARSLGPRRDYRTPCPMRARSTSSAQHGLGDLRPLTSSEQLGQKETIRLLVRSGGIDVSAKDADGNTALHYLAGTLNVDEETIALVRGMDGGERVWRESTNIWGVTPSQMIG